MNEFFDAPVDVADTLLSDEIADGVGAVEIVSAGLGLGLINAKMKVATFVPRLEKLRG